MELPVDSLLKKDPLVLFRDLQLLVTKWEL